MATWQIDLDDGRSFEIEADVRPSDDEIYAAIEQYNGGTQDIEYAQSMAEPIIDEEALRKQKKQYDDAIRAERNRREGWMGDLQALAGSALSSLTWSATDLGYRGAFGAEAAEEQRKIREANPIYSAVGTVLGFIPGIVGGPIAWGVSGVTKAATSLVTKVAGESAAKKAAATMLGKAAALGGRIATEAVLGEAQFQIQQTGEKLAGTRDFAEGNDFLQGAAFSAAADVAFRGVGAAAKPIAKVAALMSKQKKAIDAMGGAENIKRAQGALDRALKAGRSMDEAQATFTASLMQGLPEEKRAIYESLVQKDPAFAKFSRQQMAGGGEIVTESVTALTAQEYKKYSRDLLDNLYGPGYKNVLGTDEIDFSKEGLTSLLGRSNEGAAMEARKQALARAEENVMSNPSLAKQVNDEFRAATNDLMVSGSRDLQRAASMVEPASIKSYAGSEAYQEAVQAADEAVNNAAQQLMESGQQITQAQINDITMQAHRAGAQKHFKKIISESTDSIQDINDIKEFFKHVDQRAVASGEAKAFGAFNKRLNAQILDNADPQRVLYMSNQGERYEEILQNMHEFGRTFDQTKINELASKLDNGLSAQEKGMKIAAFKMGVMDSLNNAVITGDREAMEQIYAMMRSKKSLGQYFDLEEISKYMDAIRPKAEAAHNLNRILTAAGKYKGEQGVLAPAVRVVTGVATGARQQWNNAVITLLQRGLYGKGTAKMIQEFSSNPTSANLNRLIKGTKDLTERQQLDRAIVGAFDYITDRQTLVRGARELSSER